MMTPPRLPAAALTALCLLLPPVAAPAAEQAAKPALAGGFKSPGKPGAPVALVADVQPAGGGKATVAEPLEVALLLTLPADAEWLSVEVSPTESLSLVSGGTARIARPKGPVQHRVTVVAQAQGRHFLGVTVALGRHGSERMRSFAVPVTVGTASGIARAASKGQVTRNSDGEAIVITHSR